MTYRAPVAELRFLLDHIVGFDEVARSTRFADATPEMVEAILTGAGKMAQEVMAPLRRLSDQQGARLHEGRMITTPGFAQAYEQIAQGGWVAIAADPDYGGMGLPLTLSACVNDMMGAACLGLQLHMLLSQGQIEALEHHASPEIRATYLPKLISGEWSGTMNLTEPQAGSDVGALRAQAVPLGDGSYAVTGQKIFISWGDCDFVENVCHLVLARLPDAPAGTRGISLFLVPKILPNPDGTLGAVNSLRVVSLEHKMGLHGSPTAVMSFEGAKGWLVGAPHKGLAAMFTMMNNARLSVGVQGVSGADGAYQQALAYAQERVQGRPALAGTGAIIDHPDVRRTLAEMKADLFAARAIALSTAVALDMARATNDPDWQARAAFLTPIAKAYGTDTGIAVADAGLQLHGGMGFIEETGAAQFLRDVRITAIYEGTNGIQAADLVGRKMMDGGEVALRLLEEVQEGAEAARGLIPDLPCELWTAAESLREATEILLAQSLADRLAGSVAYLRAFALVLGAHFHLRAALVEGEQGARQALARVYLRRKLPHYGALLTELREGAATLEALGPDALAV